MATTNLIKAVYRSGNSPMMIIELVTGDRHWAFGPTMRDIPCGFEIGLGRFSAAVSPAFWNARRHTWTTIE